MTFLIVYQGKQFDNLKNDTKIENLIISFISSVYG